MLHSYFKQTMDRFGIKGSELAEAFGCSRNHISEIRTGKCNPPISRFWELIETMDELAPGAKQYFGALVAGHNSQLVSKPQELIERMDNDQLSTMLFAIAETLKNNRKKAGVETKAQVLAVS